MALERTDVEKIAHLARLGLNEGEIPRTTETLSEASFIHAKKRSLEVFQREVRR
jgi:Asp-tRNA(Asn)/Glu-tRNA(Gln) amidotransferase C subunit